MDLRQHYRQRRRNVTGDQRHAAEAEICKHIESLCSTASLVGAYAAFDGEPNLAMWLSSTQSTIALPQVLAAHGDMSFHIWAPTDPGKSNRFGIFEPEADAAVVDPASFDCVLVPLVAFDNHGTRLGMGSGYYDRYLTKTDKARLIGVAFDCQLSPTPLTRQRWDQPLDLVVTESGIIKIQPS